MDFIAELGGESFAIARKHIIFIARYMEAAAVAWLHYTMPARSDLPTTRSFRHKVDQAITWTELNGGKGSLWVGVVVYEFVHNLAIVCGGRL